MVNKLVNKKTDVLYAGGYLTDIGIILRQTKKELPNLRLFSGDAVANVQFLFVAGKAGEGTYFTFGPDMRLKSEARDVVAANTATTGGGIYLASGAEAAFRNVTIADNIGPEIAFYSIGPVTMVSSIVWGDGSYELDFRSTGTDYLADHERFQVSYSNLKNGWSGMGNHSDDPLFTNPSDNDWRINSGSPCIDGGDPQSQRCVDTGLGGNPRQLDGRLDGKMRVDMGAHEFDNVHFEISGTPRRGGTITLQTTGKSGLSVLLAVTTSSGRFSSASIFPRRIQAAAGTDPPAATSGGAPSRGALSASMATARASTGSPRRYSSSASGAPRR